MGFFCYQIGSSGKIQLHAIKNARYLQRWKRIAKKVLFPSEQLAIKLLYDFIILGNQVEKREFSFEIINYVRKRQIDL